MVRKWHDRKKKIDMPLFPNYLFVRIPLIDKFKIFETPGVIKFLGSNSNPSIIKDQEIDLIRKLILGNIETSNFDYKVGSEVVITSGPMKGIKGKLVRKKGKDRIVIHINTLEKNLMLDISPYSVVQV